MAAVLSNKVELVELLVSHGATVNCYKVTCIHQCFIFGGEGGITFLPPNFHNHTIVQSHLRAEEYFG